MGNFEFPHFIIEDEASTAWHLPVIVLEDKATITGLSLRMDELPLKITANKEQS